MRAKSVYQFDTHFQSGKVDKNKSCTLLERTGEACHFKDMRSKKAQEYLLKRNEKSFITTVKEATKKGYIEIEVGDGVDLSYPKSKTRRGRLMRDKSNCLLQQNEFYINEGEYLRLFTQTEMGKKRFYFCNWTFGRLSNCS